ncbi:efflux RND transporter periplasmic adaptor subunit [Wenzhouxiangella sp. AB-CW3]|uniref:efflux RND transporter periplasmic adaptor subunit n=1 Tax=Wenzhouxiangella sp. AB-CW3 TaxID=2771012 RepID=UPI00168A4E17|nr:efflux RND transporter periplasmic adaptor subunit [Wenzhouxiangella sp. AB-CW3]QOC22280.1 efflux RND transporter periplasmic adaptor subunit [Wenzhouxiangella sp. AB-CW3]
MDVQRSRRSSRKLARYLVPAVLVVVLAGLALTAWSLQSRPPAIDADRIWTGEVRHDEMLREVSAAGRLTARETRAVTNRNDGVVERIAVLPGDGVQPGSLLVEMSSPQLEDALAEARWELAEANAEHVLQVAEADNRRLDLVAQAVAAESEYTSKKMVLEAQQELGERGVYSEIEIERTRLSVEQLHRRMEAEQARLERFPESLKAEQQASEARLNRLRERVERLESNVEALSIVASHPGVVREINVEEGEQLVAGIAVARIVNTEDLVARVRVSERDAALVAPGLPATLEIGRHVHAGQVMRVEPTVRDRSVTVDIALGEEAAKGLRPELSVTARIELERVEDTLVVERPVGLSSEATTLTVFRLDPSGDRAERRQIELGRMSSREIEVVNGLVAGDRIILADLTEWADQPVLRIR